MGPIDRLRALVAATDPRAAERAEATRRAGADGAGPALFVCTTCGRDDLQEAGGWDPPVCEECDAAINFDSLEDDDGHE